MKRKIKILLDFFSFYEYLLILWYFDIKDHFVMLFYQNTACAYFKVHNYRKVVEYPRGLLSKVVSGGGSLPRLVLPACGLIVVVLGRVARGDSR